MDQRTIDTYDERAAAFAASQRGKTPAALQALIGRYFQPGAPSADIGCGSGRDSAWLATQGFPVVGYDASTGMLAEARRAFPHIIFAQAALPDLAAIADQAHTNVLCSAVLMHLPDVSLPAAMHGLARIMVPGGRLVLTYRGSQASTSREGDGRLYSPIGDPTLAERCATAGLLVLHQASADDGGRPGVRWHTLVAERRGATT